MSDARSTVGESLNDFQNGPQGFSRLIPISRELAEDIEGLKAAHYDLWEQAGRTLRWSVLGSKQPWPAAGFNPHRWTFPEPEPDYCDECGRPYDD